MSNIPTSTIEAEEEFSDYQVFLYEKLYPRAVDKDERDILINILLETMEPESEEQTVAYIEAHPEATPREVAMYVMTYLEPVPLIPGVIPPFFEREANGLLHAAVLPNNICDFSAFSLDNGGVNLV